jgi:hypothetical protein
MTLVHRVLIGIVAVLVVAAGLFAYRWQHSGTVPLTGAQAYARFRAAVDPALSAGTLRPHQGVYSYSGTASEHVSLPPKSRNEGPGAMPGTVTYQADGCWVARVDYSQTHWQSATYCPRQGALVQVGTAGWYKWDFVAFSISDTSTYTCAVPKVVIPADAAPGVRNSFSCTGTNAPLDTGPVTMTGSTEVVGLETVTVAGRAMQALHVRETDTFSGGQTGTNVADTWFSTVDALPLRQRWTTEVQTPSPVGTSTMTGQSTVTLSSLTSRS